MQNKSLKLLPYKTLFFTESENVARDTVTLFSKKSCFHKTPTVKVVRSQEFNSVLPKHGEKVFNFFKGFFLSTLKKTFVRFVTTVNKNTFLKRKKNTSSYMST